RWMRAPPRREGGDGARGHAAAADGRAAPALRRVVHTLWGNRHTPAGALSPCAEGQPAACWGRRERPMAWSRLLRSQQARRAEETSTPQEDLDTLRGPEQSDDSLADDVRQRSHPGWIAHGIVVSTPREVGTCAGEVGAWALRVA